MIKNLSLLGIIILILVAPACKKDDKSQSTIDDEIIQQYLTDNNIEATKHASGLYYVITEEGNGAHPGPYATVSVTYKGYLTYGDIFDESTEPVSFPLPSLITGWQIGIPLLKEGGEGQFFIPSALAYGSQSVGNIPANSVLIFDIRLFNIEN